MCVGCVFEEKYKRALEYGQYLVHTCVNGRNPIICSVAWPMKITLRRCNRVYRQFP